jgi:uncharacterized membrane protein YqjE
MFTSLKKAKLLAGFSAERLADYSALFQLELSEYRDELIKAVVGYIVMGISGLFFLVFFSSAIIITFWDSDSRVLVAWLVCLAWFALAAGGVWIGKSALHGPSPFEEMSKEIGRDIHTVKEAL